MNDRIDDNPRSASNESVTRAERIDHQLAKAGWTQSSRQVVEELWLAPGVGVNSNPEQMQRNEFVDYALMTPGGRPIAIVEAKRSSRDALAGERQAADYADRIKSLHGIDPFIFLANGNEVFFWYRRLFPPRSVSGFFTREDLERLAFLDRFHEPLSSVSVDTKIVDRAYQVEAIKTVSERIEQAQRKFLLVLATGTGKTRVAIALVELLRRRKWIQRVLFLADRRELIKQSLGAFKEHLPDVPRAWIEGGEIDKEARIHGATYPGMMGLYKQLSPGYYDFIICDESHRSIYHRYKDVLDHFDAIILGLTATPTDFIDHNTFTLFNCDEGAPTCYYGYDEAVRDRHLVPYRPVHVARTGFQIQGLKPGELPAEVIDQVRNQGVDPDDFSFEGTDLERSVSNTGTNDAVVREFMEQSIKDAIGTVPAKTIIFAISHRHALEIYKSFNRLYPDLQRRGLARVIDSHMERAEKTLDDFKFKDFPRVAISVDMLDTGIDVPALRNLVFAKPVFSEVKFWQMIGRGTRKWIDPISGEEKADFLIIDHWDKFAYFQVNTEGRTGSITEPMPTRLFRLRLEKLQILSGRGEQAAAEATRASLRAMFSALPLENINVAPHADELRMLIRDPSAWSTLDQEMVNHFSHALAPLLRFAVTPTWAELHFENLTEQLALAHLKGDQPELESIGTRIEESLRLLPTDLPEIRPHREALSFALSGGFWDHLDYTRIEGLQETFSPLMRFRGRRDRGQIIQLSLPDEISRRHWIVFGPGGEGSFAENYRAQVEALVLSLAEGNPALKKLRQGLDLTDQEVAAVSSILSGPDLFVSEERLREAYDQPDASLADFLRHILGETKLPSREAKISQAFDAWVRQHSRLSATQLMFVRTLRRAVLERAEVTSLDGLRKPPFTSIGDPEQLFEPNDLRDMLDLAKALAA
jgi:type I restriction enzyme, R subunit